MAPGLLPGYARSYQDVEGGEVAGEGRLVVDAPHKGNLKAKAAREGLERQSQGTVAHHHEARPGPGTRHRRARRQKEAGGLLRRKAAHEPDARARPTAPELLLVLLMVGWVVVVVLLLLLLLV